MTKLNGMETLEIIRGLLCFIITVGLISYAIHEIIKNISRKIKLKKLYESWNIGDKIQRTYMPYNPSPWDVPTTEKGIVIEKKGRWVRIKLSETWCIPLEFKLDNFKRIIEWEKIN